AALWLAGRDSSDSFLASICIIDQTEVPWQKFDQNSTSIWRVREKNCFRSSWQAATVNGLIISGVHAKAGHRCDRGRSHSGFSILHPPSSILALFWLIRGSGRGFGKCLFHFRQKSGEALGYPGLLAGADDQHRAFSLVDQFA